MFDLRRELCRSNVFCAENGDGRTRYLCKSVQMLMISRCIYILTLYDQIKKEWETMNSHNVTFFQF